MNSADFVAISLEFCREQDASSPRDLLQLLGQIGLPDGLSAQLRDALDKLDVADLPADGPAGLCSAWFAALHFPRRPSEFLRALAREQLEPRQEPEEIYELLAEVTRRLFCQDVEQQIRKRNLRVPDVLFGAMLDHCRNHCVESALEEQDLADEHLRHPFEATLLADPCAGCCVKT